MTAPRSTAPAPAPAPARLLLDDNYDSFTYNLVQHSRKPIKDDSSVSTFNCKD